MVPFAPATWSPWTVFLYSLGTVYVVGFFVFLVRFWWLERAVRAGASPQRYNKILRGFPNAFYAKMLGKRPR